MGETHTAKTGMNPAPRRQDALLLGRYRVMAQGPQSNFATVLTCWDTRLQRRVAIKRIPLVTGGTTAGQASTMDEALAEARTSSMLAHPNIVTMYDFEVDQASAYLVMEFVDGLTLAELLARVEGGTLTADECAYVVQGVSAALAFAHENGVLHLDVKPSNIMIEHSGTIKLCDFGMATLASAAGYGGARGGTVGYMPPEQIEGGMVDERSDIFSLAVVTWQALSGENPFQAESAAQSLKKIEKGPKTTLSQVDTALSGQVEDVLRCALEPRPRQRMSSVEDFSHELVACLGDAREGAASIRGLMSQDEDVLEESGGAFTASGLPFFYRHPRLLNLGVRGLSALACALAVYGWLPALLGSQQSALLGALLCAAAAAAWPPLGSALAAVAMCCSLGAMAVGQEAAAGVLLTIALAAMLVAWWARIGAREPQATLPVLLPCLVGQPLAGVALSALTLAPARAAATAGVAHAWCLVTRAVRQSDASLAGAASLLTGWARNPATWLALAASCLSAALASLVYRRGGRVRFGVLGQLLALALLVFTSILCARVENGGLWALPRWDELAVAILLCVFACVVVDLMGPLSPDEEADDIDEPV